MIEVDKNSKIIKFYKKPHKKKYIGNLCLSGIYIINKKLIKKIKNKFQDFSKDFFPKIIEERKKFMLILVENMLKILVLHKDLNQA